MSAVCLSSKDLTNEDDKVKQERREKRPENNSLTNSNAHWFDLLSHRACTLLFLSFVLLFLDSASVFCPPDFSTLHNTRISVRAWRHRFLLEIWEMYTAELTHINHPEEPIHDLASDRNRQQPGHTQRCVHKKTHGHTHIVTDLHRPTHTNKHLKPNCNDTHCYQPLLTQ